MREVRYFCYGIIAMGILTILTILANHFFK